jgi:hypothetical protein
MITQDGPEIKMSKLIRNNNFNIFTPQIPILMRIKEIIHNTLQLINIVILLHQILLFLNLIQLIQLHLINNIIIIDYHVSNFIDKLSLLKYIIITEFSHQLLIH